MKFVILLLFVIYSKAFILLRNHQEWKLSSKKAAIEKLPYIDYFWNYCDKKCLYLQNYLSHNDKIIYQFVVV